MANDVNTAGGQSVDSAFSSMSDAVSGAESKVVEAQSAAQSGSTADIMKLEVAMQRWSIMTEMESTVVKAVADAVRGIVKNIQ